MSPNVAPIPFPRPPMAQSLPPLSASAPAEAATPGQMPAETISAWWNRIQSALDGTKAVLEQGKQNVFRYQGKYLSAVPTDDTILVPTDFYYIEQKRAQLFYKLPEVFLRPMEPGKDDAVVVFQAALNHKLGPHGINILPKVQQTLFDVLCPVGFGAIKVGYQTVQGPAQSVPAGVDPTGQPLPPTPVPVTLASWFFGEHVSPGDLLVPPDFVGQDFDSSPWLGVRFREDIRDDDPRASEGRDTSQDDRRLVELPASARPSKRQRIGYEIQYRANVFDPDIHHPDQIRIFRMYDDEKDAILDLKNAPYQQCDPSGKLVQGMRGYSICPLTLRPMSDTWLAPSDCTMARPLADELSRGRTQMIQFRARSAPQVGYDATRVDQDIKEKIQRNETGAWVGFNGADQTATWAIQKGEYKRESFQFNDYVQRDLDQVWSLGPNPGGALSPTNRTATEQQMAGQSAQSRLEMERTVVLHWYLSVVEKFGALLQLFADQTEFVALVGSDAQRLSLQPPPPPGQPAPPPGSTLVSWNKDAIQGLFLYEAKANSQLWMDVAQQRKQLMDAYNFLAHEPSINRAELAREIIQGYGWDPAKLLTQPPPQAPEPPKINLNLVAQSDLNPAAPQYANVLALLTHLGVQGLSAPVTDPLTANALQVLSKGPASEVEHGGAAIAAEKISQHQANETGHLQGSGQPVPMGPPQGPR